VLADFLIGDLCDFLEQLAVPAVDFGFAGNFEKPISAGVPLSVDAMANAWDELAIRQSFFYGAARDTIEVGFS
jgi:hypothetical protein